MWAIVTGASGGIGKEIAIKLAKRGYNLVLVARSEDKLKSIAYDMEVETKVIALDLIENGACEQLFESCNDLDIHILVNNAGFGGHGKFQEREIETDMNMIDLNVKALTKLAHLFSNKLIASKKGYMLNIASSAGFLPGPGMAVYYATKAYVLSLSEALHEEMKGKVVVTALCPGPVETGFAKVANMKGVSAFESGTMSAEFVAQKAVDGMFKEKAIVIPERSLNILLRFGLRLMPRSLVRKVSAKSMSKLS